MGINCVSNSELSSSLSFGICQRESENNNTLQLQERVPMATQEKQVMIVAIDESEHSMYALEWTLDHFFSPLAPNPLFKLVIVHAKPLATSVVGLAGPGAADVFPYVDADLKMIAARVVEKAKEFCQTKSVSDVTIQVIEGDARNVLCDAVEKHHASVLVVGSHGYGAIKRLQRDGANFAMHVRS